VDNQNSGAYHARYCYLHPGDVCYQPGHSGFQESVMHILSELIFLAIVATVLPVQAAGQYTKLTEIKISGAARFDYLTADAIGKRLYVSHGTEVVVIDTNTNTITGVIADTQGVHGIVVAAELERVYTTNGRSNNVSIVDMNSLQTLSTVGTGENPDAITYDKQHQQVWSFNNDGESLTVIDAVKGKAIATTPLSGVAETGQADTSIGRMFINIEDKDSVDVVDMNTYKVIANYKVAPASSPTGMAVDELTHRLFIGGGEAMVMMDTRTGKIIDSVPICDGTDATSFDAGTSTAFVACRDGHIMVIAVTGDKLSVKQTINTAVGSRTMTLDPLTHRIYTAAVDYLPRDPAKPDARPRSIPESMRVLVYTPD